MNIYKNIINIANYYTKDNKIIREYIDLSNKLQELKSDMNYYTFFGLIDANSSYYFFAPNVALQIIKNIKEKKDFKELFTESNCNRIINNEIINKYVETSTKVNELVIDITKKIFVSLDESTTSEENYIYNRCSDELGYIGFGKLIQNFSNSGKLLEDYDKEREKIIHGAKFIFPIAILKNGLYQEFEKKDEYKDVIRNYENFNIMLTIINTLLFSCLCNKIIEFKKSDIKILSSKRKENVYKIEFMLNNATLLINSPFVIMIENELYFMLSKTIKFEKGKTETTCECFNINFEKKDSLFNFSINNLSIIL